MGLEAREVTASYGETRVLNNLSVAFAPERLTALIGPNGGGKSTLLKAILGFAPIDSGEITLDGAPIRAIDRRALARRVAYLPQENHCPDYMTLGELIELAGYARYSLLGGPSERDRRLFREALEIVGLADMARRRLNALSGGQRQRAWIALVLAQDAPIILMDEPVNHLDIKHQYAVLGLVRGLAKNHGRTVVTVLHDLNLAAAFADDVAMLKGGEIVAAGPKEQALTSANIKAVFDLETDIFAHGGRMICAPRIATEGADGADHPTETMFLGAAQ